MSGCEAAITAAQKGHRVTLLEKSGQLGGQWIPASMPVGKSEFTSLLLWQKTMLEKLHVQVLLNTQADGELIRLYEPDAVVVATGSKPFVPGFLKGADQDFVVNAHDVLLGKVEVQGKVVVVGGGLLGAETADTLSQSCQVSVIEMQPRIMGDGEYSTAYYMKQRFQQFGVQVYTSTKVLEIGSHTVAAEREGQAITLEDVDFVVIAVGVKTDTALFDQLEGLPWPVYKVGDANGVKNGYLGIREGFEAGLALVRRNPMNALTQSIAIRGVDLSGRLVMPPMASGKPNPDGTVSDSLVEYYKEKSQGGYLGLVITEHAFVCQQGRAHRRPALHQPGRRTFPACGGWRMLSTTTG